jgi:hypothetical protein
MADKYNILKVHVGQYNVIKDFDGSQFSMMSDLYLYRPEVMNNIDQVIITSSINAFTLVDTVGREGEHGWNIWATREMLKSYAAFHSVVEAGLDPLQPRQYAHIIERAGLSTSLSYYHHSYIKIRDSKIIQDNEKKLTTWVPKYEYDMKAVIPSYCKAPSSDAILEMQKWIDRELKVRCHPFRLAVPCEIRQYDGFIPCPQELMSHMALDYAAMKGKRFKCRF